MTLVERMASQLGLSIEYVRLVVGTASHRYKTYGIPKKTGGVRMIDHPARELKLFQRWLANTLLGQMPVHRAACAYKKGSTIYRNATQHKGRNYILKVDFKDFFPSIRGADIARLLRANRTLLSPWIMNPTDIGTVRKLVCKNDRLTIGAPSSPALSNLVMFEFDEKWASLCRERRVIYTRYADDLYFSTSQPNVLEGVLTDLREDLRRRRHPVLHINDDKTVFTSRKRRRLVSGLVLTPSGSISLGRHRKRFIKSLVFRHTQGRLQPDQVASLKGMLSYASSVEPSFVEALRRKYGPSATPDR